jgi:hypothetical protein
MTYPGASSVVLLEPNLILPLSENDYSLDLDISKFRCSQAIKYTSVACVINNLSVVLFFDANLKKIK